MYEDGEGREEAVICAQRSTGGSEDFAEQAVYGEKGWRLCVDLNALLFRDVQKIPMLAREVQEDLLAQYAKTKDELILNKLIESNLRFVVKIAWQYANRYSIPFLDVFSEGALGLRKAIMRYDPTFGCTLATYAAWWIKQVVVRFIINKKNTVRMPSHAHEILRKYHRASLRLMRQKKMDSSEEEICKEAGLTRVQMKYLRYGGGHDVSIETFGIDKDGDDAAMIIPDQRPLQDEVSADEDLRRKILGAIDSFRPRWRCVIVLRFGLHDNPQPIEMIAQLMKCSIDEVDTLKASALQLLGASKEVTASEEDCKKWVQTIQTSTLPPKERFVVQLHYGVVNGEWVLEDIGQVFGLTREMIRQTQNKAMKILKKRIVLSAEGEVEVREGLKGKE